MVQVEESPVFERDGFDIHSDVHVSFTQAVLGGEVRTSGLSGPILVKVWSLWTLFVHSWWYKLWSFFSRFQLGLRRITEYDLRTGESPD